jgi:GT2 family glycosyltransferase
VKKQKNSDLEMVITVIIITHNNETTIQDCLNSVFKNPTPGFQKKIVVIDNDSQDGTPKILNGLKHDRRISKIILNSFNDGFGKTINTFIEQAQKRKARPSDFFFILNPDTTLESTALSRLLEAATNKKHLGLLSCTIVHPKTKKVLFKEGSIDFLRFRTTHTAPGAFQASYVTGCALLISKSLLQKIGAFDPNFFLYYEDADFSKRTLDAGMEIATESSALCYHEESHSATSETKDYFLTRNALYFFHKHYSFFALPYFWAVFSVRLIYHKYFSKKQVVLYAMQDFWKN